VFGYRVNVSGLPEHCSKPMMFRIIGMVIIIMLPVEGAGIVKCDEMAERMFKTIPNLNKSTGNRYTQLKNKPITMFKCFTNSAFLSMPCVCFLNVEGLYYAVSKEGESLFKAFKLLPRNVKPM
jgi:hypothetical protein